MLYSDDVVKEIKCIEKEGENQFQNFWNERLIVGKISINAKIKKNKFSVMNTDLKTKSSPSISTPILNKVQVQIGIIIC